MCLLKDIVDFISDNIINIYGYDEMLAVDRVGGVFTEEPNALGWIAPYKENKQYLAEHSGACCLIVDENVQYTELLKNKVLIQTANPRLVFILIASKFFPASLPSHFGGSYIKPQIGCNTLVSPSAILMNCSIGNNCIIHPNVVIYDDVIIGNNTIIHAGTVIGNTGLGCERDLKGILHTFPHYSTVKIGSSVIIGPNCKIPRGTLSPTQIGDGTKIDGLCTIGHNAVVGINNWIGSSVTIAGSALIGDNNTIYAAVAIKDQITIGDNNVIGLGSVVVRNIPSNELWFGNPAKKYKDL